MFTNVAATFTSARSCAFASLRAEMVGYYYLRKVVMVHPGQVAMVSQPLPRAYSVIRQ